MRIIMPDRNVITISFFGAIEDMLKILGLDPASVIVVKNGAAVPEDVFVNDDDELRIIGILHGG